MRSFLLRNYYRRRREIEMQLMMCLTESSAANSYICDALAKFESNEWHPVRASSIFCPLSGCFTSRYPRFSDVSPLWKYLCLLCFNYRLSFYVMFLIDLRGNNIHWMYHLDKVHDDRIIISCGPAALISIFDGHLKIEDNVCASFSQINHTSFSMKPRVIGVSKRMSSRLRAPFAT